MTRAAGSIELCGVCGDAFDTTPTWRNNPPRRYCSRRCAALSFHYRGGKLFTEGYEDKKGYRFVSWPGHPLAQKTSKVAWHRHVAMMKLGRLLFSNHTRWEREEVDHVNEDPRDNRPENLMILPASIHRAKTLSHWTWS